MTGLSHDADGEPIPLAQERAKPRRRLEDPFVGWTATLAIALLSLFLRLWRLGTPHAFEFDETYYAKDAWSLWHFGYARDYIDNDGGVANKHILAGQTTHLWKPDASMVVHPEVGKWLIGLGEKVFGFTPLGWRVVPAIIGTLLILVLMWGAFFLMKGKVSETGEPWQGPSVADPASYGGYAASDQKVE